VADQVDAGQVKLVQHVQIEVGQILDAL